MATNIISAFNLFSTFEITGSAGRWILRSGVMIYPDSGPAINEDNTHADNQIFIDGSAISLDVAAIASAGASSDITVYTSGTVVGNTAGILTSGANESITNLGSINGRHLGIQSAGESLLVDNSGLIAGSVGIAFGDLGGDIINRLGGVISGEHAIETNTTALETVKLQNKGTVIGTLAYDANGLGSDVIINRGLIKGDILLGDGNDTFDNIGGKFRGEVSGGAGSDIYIVDKQATVILENPDAAGTDTVETTISYKLGKGLENLTLLGNAGRSGTGNASDNVLTGNRGKNELFGRDGSDTLIGGTGNDTLEGGRGADLFIFKTGDGHDTITDFTRSVDHVDLSSLNGIESFDDMKHNHILIADDHITIVDGTDQIVLVGIAKNELRASQFDF